MLQISGPLSSPTTIRRDRHPPRTIISGGFLVSHNGAVSKVEGINVE